MPKAKFSVGPLLAFVACVFFACSNSDQPGDQQPATNCAARCSTFESACGSDPGKCTQLCTTLTEGALVCLEGSHCDAAATNACFGSNTSGLAGGAGGGNGFGAGGSPMTSYVGGGPATDMDFGGTSGSGMAQCQSAAQCQTMVMCSCGDGTTVTTPSGDCVAGQCFHDGDASACSNACLSHSAP